MAPDLPLEPAPRYDFSSSTTRPTWRRDKACAMLAPITPPPTIRRSQVCMARTSSSFNSPRAYGATANSSIHVAVKLCDFLLSLLLYLHDKWWQPVLQCAMLNIRSRSQE